MCVVNELKMAETIKRKLSGIVKSRCQHVLAKEFFQKIEKYLSLT